MDTGRAQSAALLFLCLFAGAQIILVGAALWRASAGGIAAAQSPHASASPAAIDPQLLTATPSQINGRLSPPAPGQLAPPSTAPAAAAGRGASWSVPAPGVLAEEARAMDLTTSRLSPAVPVPPAPSGQRDPEVAAFLDAVEQLRASGDLSGILDLLKAAEGIAADDPEVLKEFAQTYEQMGLPDKAREYWLRIHALGPVGGGAFYPLAAARVRPGSSAAPDAFPADLAPGMPPVEIAASRPRTGKPARDQADGASLTLDDCMVTRDAAVVDGERQMVRIPIRRVADAAIDPNAVTLDVFFFDEVEGGAVEPTRADPPAFDWVAAPVDWADELELLDVTYFLPPLTGEEIRNHGRRQFHGFVLKLYYQGKLQCVLADPPGLMARAGAAAGGGLPSNP
jgi:hypothetical protein